MYKYRIFVLICILYLTVKMYFGICFIASVYSVHSNGSLPFSSMQDQNAAATCRRTRVCQVTAIKSILLSKCIVALKCRWKDVVSNKLIVRLLLCRRNETNTREEEDGYGTLYIAKFHNMKY